ncbi:PREDICTED: uncharacterized protein LOC104588559 isoform X2 [Nelumbo nucifera]|uniref:Uncharacterized protein LOC104588559 isoform X2 n=1 Tax=Nelumbo nucifera TaxID=4432 RepID=A0A1U7ZAQ6_NELNU|nr:PREDICTED: uncharacterized protein LOC104588559 isoform X2 [Nelumbo nucifera]
MKLEDIFTQLEMMDGFASIPSVEKLVCFMQHEKSYNTKSVVETTNHLSTIAGILTATKNMDYLKQFIELGGLHCLDRWLQEAQKYGNINSSDNNVEDPISTVLEALINLPLDQHCLKACGIGTTVMNFLSHKNPKIQGKAKNLSDQWAKFTDKESAFEKCRDQTSLDHESSACKGEMLPKIEGEHPGYGNTVPQDFPPGACVKGDANSWKSHHSSSISSSSTLQFEAGKDVKDNISAEGTSGTTFSRNCGFTSSTSEKDVAVDGSPRNREAPGSSLERTVSAHVSEKSEMGSETGMSCCQEGQKLASGEEKTNQENAGEDGASLMPLGLDDGHSKTESSSSNSKHVILPISSSSDSCHKTSMDAESCIGSKKGTGKNNSVCIGFKCSLAESPGRKMTWGLSEHGSLDYWKKIMEWKPEKQIGSCVTPKATSDTSAALLGHGNIGRTSQAVEIHTSVTLLGKQGNPGKTSQAVKVSTECDAAKVLEKIAEENSRVLEKADGPKSRLLQQKNAERVAREDTEMELTYEMDDALEVARRVAREVEKEVGTYREASGSSSSIEDRNGHAIHQSTADSLGPKAKFCSEENVDKSELCSEQEKTDSCCSIKEEMEPEISARNQNPCMGVKTLSQEIGPTIVHEKNDGVREQEASKLTTAPEDEAPDNQITSFRGFDLNEDIKTEEADPDPSVTETISSCHVNVSTPIPVVATSRIPACLPKAPLKFEGELGWRGSAATSAFKPTSLFKTSNKEKASFTDDTNYSSRHSQGFQGIDLNVADGGDDSVMELFPGKHASVSSALLSGESSLEVGSKRAERLNLDLNRLGDNEDYSPQLSSEWKTENKHHLPISGACNPSPTFLKPSVRDIDLNDNPSIGEARNDVPRSSESIQCLRNGALNGSAFSIMGTTVQLGSNNVISAPTSALNSVQAFGHDHDRKEFMHPSQPFLMAGPGAIPSVEQGGKVVALQPTLAYAPSPAFSYNNGFAIGPSVPLPSTIYPSGVVPYMIDTRGATIIPQILGSSTLPTYPRAPFITEIAGGPGAGNVTIVRPGLDLNAGVNTLEQESRGGNVRHLFIPATTTLVEEQMKSFQQVAMSGPPMKRKEPDCGWDSYQIGYKQI